MHNGLVCCGANAARLGVTTIRQEQVQESSECSEALGGCCWAGEGRSRDGVQVIGIVQHKGNKT